MSETHVADQVGKYARIERERRFLLEGLPAGLTRAAPHSAIVDGYLTGTRFRLRRMRDSASGMSVYKLTQKYVPPAGSFTRTVITNSYLTEQEYVVFAALPATHLHKDRYRYVAGGYQYAVDLFGGALQGLALAEIEFATDEGLQTFGRPAFAVADVTDYEAFTGGALCHCSYLELQGVIEEIKAHRS